MNKTNPHDAAVVGSGPNGLSAAIVLAQAGLPVTLYEGKETIGGGLRSAELTLPGYIHDICSAIHPLGIGSPFFKTLPLQEHGLNWIHPLAPLAHPLDDGSAVMLERSIESTAGNLGDDARAYKKLMTTFVEDWESLLIDLLAPLHFPRSPLLMAKFGMLGIRSAYSLAKNGFKGARAQALFAGLAAHSFMPLDQNLTAAFGLILGLLGHAVGWPMPQGGSQEIAKALASYFTELGGRVVTNRFIDSIDELEASKVLLDVTPKQLLKLAERNLSNDYKRKLEKYRYGPGVFKVDWALSHPIPWQAKECLRAGTVHVGGTLEEIARSEKEVNDGKCPEKPFVLLAQQSLFDLSRAPPGKHTAWAYCHVPNGSTVDMREKIEAQIERFAPGFRDCILAANTRSAMEYELYNPNNVGGDINGGVQDVRQLFSRPVSLFSPYNTPVEGLYLCSSSTPPGGGVHGMCGYWAARVCLS